MASQSSLATVLLANRLVTTGPKPLGASEFWALVGRVGDPAALLGASVESIMQLGGWELPHAERLTRLLDNGTAVAFELERLEQSGIRVVTPFDAAYPSRLNERLQQSAPPLLFVAGQSGLFAERGVAIVGSRDVDSSGADVARLAAIGGVQRGHVVISGGARGVDQLAMRAALDDGGAVVGVLAEAMTRLLKVVEIRRAVLDGSMCVCSPFKPDVGFTAGNAMARNKIIYALARVALVVASDMGQGGTWAGATEAIRKRYAPVAVWRGPGEGPGNAALQSQGATPVEDVDDLFDVQPLVPLPPAPQQLDFEALIHGLR